MAITNPRTPLRVCFSYAAYTKNLIDYLKSSNIPIEEGLTDVEFSSIESTFNFKFPPDLHSILQEGLPVGPGFPNWRSSSVQQLKILTNLPILGICKEISRNRFWLDSWGDRPDDDDQAVDLGQGLLRNAPFLFPVFRNFYIPAVPCMAGNPVFYVHGGDVQLWSFDVAGFFQQVEFRLKNEGVLKRPTLSKLFDTPAWAATEPRRIEFWSELVERGGKRAPASGCTRGWWSGELSGYLEEVFWRLRNGGWKEEDVREMMMMDGCDDENDDHDPQINDNNNVLIDKDGVVWHVRVLSKRLLRGGWSTEDVVESLGFPDDYIGDPPDEDSWFDFQHDQIHNANTNQLMNMHSIKV
ncbi:hypothetical protein ACH5RR_013926 [Cinchona calisaya]|uniref:Uncharacterized protein n=1 Tax=Cinchona calisaya TaxID=153742 RepID=A0ABD3A1E9_9GENT